ncbi:hypothetical protein ACFLWL_02730 [Chloroflexota bacterium]
MWKNTCTTNMFERVFREVRRPARPMGFFPQMTVPRESSME